MVWEQPEIVALDLQTFFRAISKRLVASTRFERPVFRQAVMGKLGKIQKAKGQIAKARPIRVS